MNFLMAYLSAAERIENIVAGDHDQRSDAPNKQKPLVSKTKICWLLLLLTVAIPMAIFIGILQFFPSLMDISQGILNERKANNAVQVDNVAAHPPWSYNRNVPAGNYPAYPLPPMYPPPPIAHDEYHPKAAFDRANGERRGHVPTPPALDEYSARSAFDNLNPERNPYDAYQQPPRMNPNYRIFQGLGHEAYPPLSAVDDAEEEAHRDHVRSPDSLEIDSADAKLLLSKIDPNWQGKVAAFKKRLQQPAVSSPIG